MNHSPTHPLCFDTVLYHIDMTWMISIQKKKANRARMWFGTLDRKGKTRARETECAKEALATTSSEQISILCETELFHAHIIRHIWERAMISLVVTAAFVARVRGKMHWHRVILHHERQYKKRTLMRACLFNALFVARCYFQHPPLS